MDNKNNVNGDQQTGAQNDSQAAKNPFENSQSVQSDIGQSQEEIEKEQQFKEALTERD